MGRLRLRLCHVMPSGWAYRLKNKESSEAPESPYFRCCEQEAAAKIGLADKFCLSPVNRKSLDIAYPVKNAPPAVEGEAVFVKRHLRKAAVVSVGCGCRPTRSKNVRRKHRNGSRKDLKFIQGDHDNKKESSVVENTGKDLNSEYCWEKEDGWHVIAKVNDEIIRKKVVLKRRTENGKKCPPGSPVSSPDVISVNSCFARTAPRRTKKKKKKIAKPRDAKSSENTTCFNYRLSTSSADTVLDASTAYSWDKEYGSFVSDEDENLFSSKEHSVASDHYKSFSSESSFEFYESRSPHLSTIDESPRNPRRLSLKSSRRRSGHKKLPKRQREGRTPTDLSPEHDISGNAEKLPLISSPDSTKLEAKDDNVSATSGSSVSAGLVCDQGVLCPWRSEAEDLEATAKTWRESSLRRDDIRTIIYKSSEFNDNPHCLPFVTKNSHGRRSKAAKSTKNSRRSSSRKNAETSVSRSDTKCFPRRKLDEDLSGNGNGACVQSLPSNVEGKVRESVAVVKSSQDPYQDFKASMLEMILEKQIYQADDLEQLLHCFLSLNSRQHHEIIVQVFTEIWGKMFCSTRNPSTPVKCFLSDD
eukprot:Gb_27133 [translate_table: standard]